MKNNKRKTQEDFCLDVHNLFGLEYDVLGQYINCETKILIKHNECGYIWNIMPYNFLRGQKCPKCSKIIQSEKYRKTHDQFIKEVELIWGNEYIVLNKYTDSKTKILAKHNNKNCQYIWETLPQHLKKLKMCPKCSGNYKKNNRYF